MPSQTKVKSHQRRGRGRLVLVGDYRRKTESKVDTKVLAGVGLVGIGLLTGGGVAVARNPELRYHLNLIRKNPQVLFKKKYQTSVPKDLQDKLSAGYTLDPAAKKAVEDLAAMPSYSSQAMRKTAEKVRSQYEKNLQKIGDILKKGELDNWKPAPAINPKTAALEYKPKIEPVSLSGSDLDKDYFTLTISGRTNFITGTSSEYIRTNFRDIYKGHAQSISTYNSWLPNISSQSFSTSNKAYAEWYRQGFDPTTVETAITAYKSHLKYPNKNIVLVGASSGGIPANDAAIILQRAGVPKERLKVITLGGERNLAAPEFSNSLHLLDKQDKLARSDPLFKNITEVAADWNDPRIARQLPSERFKGHLASVYLSEHKTPIREFLGKTPVKKAARVDAKGVGEELKRQEAAMTKRFETLRKKQASIEKMQGKAPLSAIEKVQREVESLQDEIEKKQTLIDNLRKKIGGNFFFMEDFASFTKIPLMYL